MRNLELSFDEIAENHSFPPESQIMQTLNYLPGAAKGELPIMGIPQSSPGQGQNFFREPEPPPEIKLWLLKHWLYRLRYSKQ